MLISFAREMFRGATYHTRVGISSGFATSAGGVLNRTYNVSGVTAVSEWTALGVLFQETFIHSMDIRVNTYNAGPAVPLVTSLTAGFPISSTSSGANGAITQGIISVSLQNAEAAYAAADSMIPNPTRQYAHSGMPHFSHKWHNIVAFRPEAESAILLSWQGWTPTGSVAANYGGIVQYRTVSDSLFGTGGFTYTIGAAAQEWELSFRVRD